MKVEKTLREYDEEAIEKLLLYKSVTKASEDTLVLSDGTELTIVPNDGGCSCGAGDYYLEELNGCENMITSVLFDKKEENDSFYYGNRTYQIFVYAENKKINLLSVEGDDGSGYYGTGYRIDVCFPQLDG